MTSCIGHLTQVHHCQMMGTLVLSIRGACCREQALKAFKGGCISLEERALVDLECEAMLQGIRDTAAALDAELPANVQLLCTPPVATYHINLSGAGSCMMSSLQRRQAQTAARHKDDH